MGLFKKMFGGPGETPQQQASQAAPPPPCTSEQELIERYGGIALDKQNELTEIIGEKAWNVDIQKGEISFGGQLVFPIQILGTFSHSTETWLWAWANTQSGLPPGITEQARHLQKYGEENAIALLRNGQFDAEKNDLHLISLIASGMFHASGYYLADYGQGIMCVTIHSDVLDAGRTDSPFRVATVFPQLISLFEMNHKNAFKNYLQAKGYSTTEDAQTISGIRDGHTVTGTFDELSRLTNLKG